MVSSFAASACAGVVVFSSGFLEVSNAGSEVPAADPVGPGHFEAVAAVGQVDLIVLVVGTEAIAGEGGLEWPVPVEALARSGAARTVAEVVGRVEACHFREADHHAVTAGWHFVRVYSEAAPKHAEGYVGPAVHFLLGRPGPELVAPAVVVAAAASRGIAVDVGNFAVGREAFAAEDAPC